MSRTDSYPVTGPGRRWWRGSADGLSMTGRLGVGGCHERWCSRRGRWSSSCRWRPVRRVGEPVLGASGGPQLLAGDGAGVRVRPGELQCVRDRAGGGRRRGRGGGSVRVSRLAASPWRSGAGDDEPSRVDGAVVVRVLGDGRHGGTQPGAAGSPLVGVAGTAAGHARSRRTGAVAFGRVTAGV